MAMKTPQHVDALGTKKWQAGLCHIYAEALRDYLGKGDLACLWVDKGFAHIFLSLDGLAYDSENKGAREQALIDYWRDKMKARWSIELEKRSHIQEFVPLGLRLGSGDFAEAYDGPERSRWYTEAKLLIEADPFYQALKTRNPHDDKRPPAEN